MTNSLQTQNESIPPAIRVSTLIDAGVRSISRLAEELARAQRAAILAALPRQRLSELRALYQDTGAALPATRAASKRGGTPFLSVSSMD